MNKLPEDYIYPDNTCDGAPLSKPSNFDKSNTSQMPDGMVKYLDKQAKKMKKSNIQKPDHYQIFPDMEVIDIIRKSLTGAEFMGYCKGNILKYRLRDKQDIGEDFEKSKEYEKYLNTLFGSDLPF